MMTPVHPCEAVAALPRGRYVVAVSGGADSTALACLLAARGDCELLLFHFNYELRGQDSNGDEAFVTDLANRLGSAHTIVRAHEVVAADETNAQARYRSMRFVALKRLTAELQFDGVAFAHHRDDVAETVLMRLARGGGLTSLVGMACASQIGGLTIHRPLLGCSKQDLVLYLRSIDQPWREDRSNASTKYRRNVARALLAENPSLTDTLVDLAGAARRATAILDSVAPALGESFETRVLKSLPRVVARHAVRRWLVARGAPPDAVSLATCKRLVDQIINTAAPARQHYPGGLLVRRRQKRLDVMYRVAHSSPNVARGGKID